MQLMGTVLKSCSSQAERENCNFLGPSPLIASNVPTKLQVTV